MSEFYEWKWISSTSESYQLRIQLSKDPGHTIEERKSIFQQRRSEQEGAPIEALPPRPSPNRIELKQFERDRQRNERRKRLDQVVTAQVEEELKRAKPRALQGLPDALVNQVGYVCSNPRY